MNTAPTIQGLRGDLQCAGLFFILIARGSKGPDSEPSKVLASIAFVMTKTCLLGLSP